MGNRITPITTVRTNSNKITAGKSDKFPAVCTFSFKDFQQIEYFGLSHTNKEWFASLLSRLKDLSKLPVEEFARNHTFREQLRYHSIDWNATNIPVKREELTWIDKDIIDNDEEFPFYQFHISRALGRVIGYWFENVFHIVLLDPFHNLQPSKKHNYQIRPCNPVETDLSTLLSQIDKIMRRKCIDDQCTIRKGLADITQILEPSNLLILFLDDDYLEALDSLKEKYTIGEIVEMGILVGQENTD